MTFFLGFFTYITIFQVILLACLVTAEKTDTLLIKDVTSSERHSKEYCAMYGICGERSDGKVLNCPYGSPSVKPDELFSAKIESLCPSITGNVCCTETQFETLRAQVQQAIPFLVGCPACLRNFLNLFCELSCSPNQSQFINVTSVSEVNGNMTVDSIDYYVTSTFGEELYNSCKDVKFGTMNTRAIDFIGAGAKSFKEWFAFIGQKVPPGFPGSPYAINFKLSIPESSGLELMNVSTYSCGDTSLGCSCGDCPLSPMCSSSEPPSPPRKEACTIRIGSLKVKCVELSLVIAYVVLISTFFGWALFQRTRERRIPPSSVEPLIKSTSDSGPDSGIMKEVNARDLLPTEGGGLSVVQGYMLSFYRTYGRWVAANPAFVLCVSLAIAFVLCLGVIRFKVETRPEKLWVGPGSRAAGEKQFFDSHLAPFYRIEQLILATLPDPKNGKQPSIITEDNFQLLFEMQKKVDGVRANDSASLVSITDICLKPLGEDCASQSVLQYFKMDPENYDSYGGIEHAEYCFQHYASSDTCLSAFKAPLDPSTVLGGFSGNNYSEASAFIITYPVNNAIDETSKENRKAVAWEKAFIQLAKEELLPMVQSSNLTLSFSSESSLEEELKRESTADVVTMVASYLVMFAYISVALGDTPRFSSFYISSKVLLGLSGVILVMLSVLGSVGFFSAIGVKSTLIIMEVIPFLVLAVGVDNMCILVNAVKRQPTELVLETRISNALVEVGPSITLASLSEFLAFAVGSFIPMPACRVFSMFAALAVLLDFFLQVTAFVALIIFDCLRAEDNRIDCFPCIKIPSSGGESDEGINQRSSGLLARYMKEVHAPILGLWGVKMVVVSVFLAFTVASIALSTRIEAGLEQQIVLPRDSYLQGYFDNTTEYLRVGPPLYFVVKDYNYSSESRHTNQLCSISQCDSNSLLNEISRASSIPELSYIAKPAASWLDDFLVWTSPEAFGCCRKFVNGTYCPPDDQPPCCSPDEEPCGVNGVCKDCTTCFRHSDLVNNRPSTEQFREKLPWFLNALPSADCAKGGHGAYSTSVDLNGYESGIIQASEFRTFHTPLNKQGDYVNSLRAAREFSSRMSDTLKININDTQQLQQLNSYFHHPTAATTSGAAATTGPSPTNGLLPSQHQHHNNNNNNNDGGGGGGGMVYPHSVASSAMTSTLEPAKKKRGRPRKYGTPEQALAAKKTAAYSNSKGKREQRELHQQQQQLLGSGGSGSSYSGAPGKSQLGGIGNLGQGFTPHVISVAAGEDVGQKIMLFMQQSKREICILSASGSISNASLRQPATSGGNITYEGRFEIVSLSGSYVRTDLGGRTGGLSVCLSSTDGQIIGGGVGGPLKAAGPVQVIVGTFQVESMKDVSAGLKGDSSGSKLASPVAGASVSSVGFRSPIESYGRNPVRGNNDFQTIGGTHFMIQPYGNHVSPTQAADWRGSLDTRSSADYDMTGRTGRGGNQSPENGDYDQIVD